MREFLPDPMQGDDELSFETRILPADGQGGTRLLLTSSNGLKRAIRIPNVSAQERFGDNQASNEDN
ncbi:hypothetical protein EOL96_01795 [Candidatus Saccharibacteria bacterium]|nr:hypothetical protein [Candidatus Saccharibacteria bacterium]